MSFLLALLFGLAPCASPSLESICNFFPFRISRVAVHYRFNRSAVVFLKKCFELILQKVHLTCSVIHDTSFFKRVLVADSTQWQIHPSLAHFFRGAGGGGSKAACKLQTVIEPKTGVILLLDYLKATVPDQGYSKKLVKLLLPNDLILFDLGYYSVDVFKRIHRAKAFFIIPIYYNAIVRLPSIAPCRVAALLFQHKKHSLLDLNLTVGSEKRMDLRMVASKATPQRASAMRRKVKEDYRRRGKRPSKVRLQYCDWNVVITNAPSTKVEPQQILHLYSSRWMIEIFFRDLKSLLKLDARSISKRYRFESQILATLILAMILFSVHGCFNQQYMRNCYVELSFSKFIMRLSEAGALLHLHLLAQTNPHLFQAIALLKRLANNSIKFHQPSRYTPLQRIHAAGELNG